VVAPIKNACAAEVVHLFPTRPIRAIFRRAGLFDPRGQGHGLGYGR
jgi:hypothetical protein